MMNKLYLILLFVSLLLLNSCKEKDDDFLAPVRNVRLVSTSEKLTVTWLNPKSNILDFVEIKYKDATEGEKTLEVKDFIGNPSDGMSTAYIILDIYESKEIEFTLVACSNKGYRSEEVKAVGAALASKYDVLLSQINVTGGIGSLHLTWDKNLGSGLSIKVVYMLDGKEQVVKLEAEKESSSSIQLPVKGIFDVAISVEDSKGNSRQIREEALTIYDPSQFKKIARTHWTIFDLSDEETVGESAPHHGYARNMFDGNLNTFWHTRYIGGAVPFPHWVVIDMNQDVILSEFITTGRQNWTSGGHKKQTIYVSRNGVEWTHLATFNFDHITNAPQAYKLDAGKIVKARYIKLELLDGVNNAPYAYIAEFDAVGIIEE